MNVLVCVKRVPAPGARINLTPDGRAIDTKHLGFTMSPHEECALEEAVRIAERTEGKVTVLTLGPDAAEEQLRYGVSIGCADAVLIPVGDADVDPQATARAITAAVHEMESTDGAFDLILVGNDSADSGGFQVGIRLAHALDRPMINGIKSLELGDGTVTARRETGEGFEEYRLPLPALVGVKEGINLPRYPTMKGRLASRKVEVRRMELEIEPGGQTMIRLVPTVEEVSQTELLGTGADAAARIVDLLEEIGAL